MANPFELVKSACSSIENEVLSGKLDIGQSDVFVFLGSLGYHADTVLYADEINAHPGIPARHVFHSMHALIQPKRNRFSKWIKPEVEFKKETISEIIRVLKVSTESAMEIARLMKEDGLIEEFEKKIEENKKKKR